VYDQEVVAVLRQRGQEGPQWGFRLRRMRLRQLYRQINHLRYSILGSSSSASGSSTSLKARSSSRMRWMLTETLSSTAYSAAISSRVSYMLPSFTSSVNAKYAFSKPRLRAEARISSAAAILAEFFIGCRGWLCIGRLCWVV